MNNLKYRKAYLGELNFNTISLEDVKKYLNESESFTSVHVERTTDYKGKHDGWRIKASKDNYNALLELDYPTIDKMSDIEELDIKEHIEIELLKRIYRQKEKDTQPEYKYIL